MEQIVKNGKALRLGYTTGSCAAAAAKAAAMALFTGEGPATVKLSTPKGIVLMLDVADMVIQKDRASCAIIKDGGDDPDVTHGLKIYGEVKKTSYNAAQAVKDMAGVSLAIEGGLGVGIVTKPGLAIAPGKPAINPVPLEMIRREVLTVCHRWNYQGGILVTISVPEGVKAANNTYNPRLGIVGGISILGTSGIVEPMSQEALIKTIQTEMGVYRETAGDVLILSPGNYGADFARNHLGIRLDEGVKCANFIGEALDYAKYIGFSKILLIGHTGKLIKLAGGVMNTHSSIADCRMEILASHLGLAGGDTESIKAVMTCVTTDEALNIIEKAGLLSQVRQSVDEKIRFHLDYRLGRGGIVEYILFHGQGQIFLRSAGAYNFVREVRL